MEKRDARKLNESELIELRNRVQKTYSSFGGNAAKTARELGVSRYFVIKWMNKYWEEWNLARKKGLSVKDIKLEAKKRGRRANGSQKIPMSYNDLPEEIRIDAKNIIDENSPIQMGIKSLLWTERSVKKLFKIKYNIELNHSMVYEAIKDIVFPSLRYLKNYREFKNKYRSYNGYGFLTWNGYIYFLKKPKYERGIEWNYEIFKLVKKQRKRKRL